jgi:hypothetical protein
MQTLCIVPCGSKKIWDKIPNAGPTPARNVYIGGFAKKCREYAEKFYPASWCILSAKYGFIFPDEIIPEPYNVSFNRKSSGPISTPDLIAQTCRKGLKNFDEIIVLGVKNYVQFARQVFPNKTIVAPLSGCRGIGYMMEKLEKLVNSGSSRE